MRACGAQLSLRIAGTWRTVTSAGFFLIQSNSAGCSSLQNGHPYQKKSMTSMFAPVSTGCGEASTRYSMFCLARISCAAVRPASASRASVVPPAIAFSAARRRMGLFPLRRAILARHRDDLVEHLEELVVIHRMVSLQGHRRRHEVPAVHGERGRAVNVVVARELDRALDAALHAERAIGILKFLPVDAVLADPVEQDFGILEAEILVVNGGEHLVMQLVHGADDFERVVGARKRYPGIGEHRGNPLVIHVRRFLG